ncbi:hypothetical protein VBD025_02290 [Virgibacillus flavescens]|uniref:hypothetical protein n=1 Tax=Virgibacillus flavescens TaxID=1611422 RepID=UPI003D336E58
MKKYWKVSLVAIVILLGFGTFYIKSAMSAPEYPAFVFKNQVGDEEEVNPLVLDGYYQEGGAMAGFSTQVQVTSNGTDYRDNISLLDQITGYYPEKIKELQDEYRGFMRGKGPMINSYFESDQFVAYADATNKVGNSKSDFTINVSLLNKSDNQTKSFPIKVPDSSGIDYIDIQDVQVIDNKLYLVTDNMVANKDEIATENIIYTIDVASEKLIENQMIFSNLEVPQRENEDYTNVNVIQASDDTNQHVVFLKSLQKDLPEEQRTVETVQEINVYDLVTGEMERLNIPEKLKESQVSLFDGTMLYFTSYVKQELIIMQYNIKDKEIENEFEVKLANEAEDMIYPLLSLKDEKLYVASQQINLSTPGRIAIFDVTTGEALYTSEIVRADENEKAEQFELNLHEILIK